jgi:TfoX/Sxy family transcriptional regulator of competence genes
VAYSEELAERIREIIDSRPRVVERKMFGGVAWMVNGNMACGVIGEDLMVRLDRDEAEQALVEEHVGPMDFTGRRMRGFIVVEAAGISDAHDLGRWVDTGADYAEALPAKTSRG